MTFSSAQEKSLEHRVPFAWPRAAGKAHGEHWAGAAVGILEHTPGAFTYRLKSESSQKVTLSLSTAHAFSLGLDPRALHSPFQTQHRLTSSVLPLLSCPSPTATGMLAALSMGRERCSQSLRDPPFPPHPRCLSSVLPGEQAFCASGCSASCPPATGLGPSYVCLGLGDC